MPILTDAQRQQFDDEGYVVVDGVLDAVRDIGPVLAEYEGVLDEIAHSLKAEGAIDSLYDELPFPERLIRLCVESGRNFPQHFDFSLPQKNVRADTPFHAGPAVFNLLTNPRLLDIAEEIIGPEVYSNPVQHIRMKLPPRAVSKVGGYNGLVSRIPWHQDNGVLLPEADEATILTIWAPITEATIENGCLQVIPRSHRKDLVAHCPTEQGLTIPDKLLPAQPPVPLPMQPGSLLLMTQRTMHSSLDNVSHGDVRISFDLRYQPVGQPTGRPAFPGFVARSKARPETVLRDPEAWSRSWYDARARLAEHEDPSYNRWRADSPVCA
jgi:phytanoyl-CoA hydroxylase